MCKVTRESIKDSDINIKRVENRLFEIAESIKINNKNNLTDINVICEEIFGQILNKLYDINLVSMSAEVSGNFIAVDLVDYKKRIATQRGYGEMKDGWEFPGGKIEKGETPEEALKREIIEELETEIEVLEYIDTIEYDYPTFHLSMECFFAKIIKGDLVLKEHEAARWLTEEELYSVEWLPADISLIEKIKRTL